jgi:hypothetical protein
MIRMFAIIFGVIMLVFGVLGFIPSVKENEAIFGIFHVNFLHNLFHIGTGFIALLCGLQSYFASRLFFQAFGVIYIVLGLMGFYYWNEPILGLLANNFADTVLHFCIGSLALFIGFGKIDRKS